MAMMTPPLAGAVQLSQDDAGDVDGVAEDFCLLNGVLPGGRIEHEQRFVWARRRCGRGDEPSRIFTSSRKLGGMGSCVGSLPARIHDQHIDGARLGRFAGVISDRPPGRPPCLCLMISTAEALGPDRQLMHPRRARKRVAGAQQHLLAHLLFEQPSKLGDAGGFFPRR